MEVKRKKIGKSWYAISLNGEHIGSVFKQYGAVPYAGLRWRATGGMYGWYGTLKEAVDEMVRAEPDGWSYEGWGA